MMKRNVRSLGMLLLASLFFAGCASKDTGEAEAELVDYVDPMIGTGFHGHTFPGAVVPFGRVQLSPDTHLEGWDASSGYHYEDSTIYGFSHTHLSGTGIGDMGDVLFLPYTGDIPDEAVATFSHDREDAKPGHYSVVLEPWEIQCELAATKRSGWHRYTYPEDEAAGLLIDLGHILQPDWGHQVLESSIKVVDERTIEGYRMTSGWAEKDPVWFRAEFDAPFDVNRVDVDGEDAGPVKTAEGEDVKMWLSFDDPDGPVGARVTISSVDRKGAERNMNEIEGLNSFDEVVKQARQQWEETLSAIRIKSDDDDVLTNFYTSMYHA
ncbi:MAG: glycoside hydrolase domain-containing protein, partial [Bacteroidota bacterium]